MCFVCDLSILAPGQTNIEPSTQGFKPKPSIFGKAILNESSTIALMKAIESGVLEIIKQGYERKYWTIQLQNKGVE